VIFSKFHIEDRRIDKHSAIPYEI